VINTPSSVTYPRPGDLDNFTMGSDISPATITIPAQLIAERANREWQQLLVDMWGIVEYITGSYFSL